MNTASVGRRSAIVAGRGGLIALTLVAALGLSACTTVEGTNALTDAGTFEREVMSETARGLGIIPRDEKEETNVRRGPLVLPRDTATLPAPTQATTSVLPPNSDTVQIDTSNLTEDDLQRLRNARVVDLRSIAGRPLTEDEARRLTARMQAANMAQTQTTNRPLYLPPEEYFTTVGDQQLVCLAGNGDIVPLTDPSCPAEVRNAHRR
jgi:hypothetical protein